MIRQHIGHLKNKELDSIDAINTNGIKNTHPFQANNIKEAQAVLSHQMYSLHTKYVELYNATFPAVKVGYVHKHYSSIYIGITYDSK